MKAEKENYRVNMMARVLEVSRSGFYRWLKTEAAQTPDPYGELKEHIEEIWLKSRKRFGYRKIHVKIIKPTAGNAVPEEGEKPWNR